jgi:hypothetical protein
MGLEIEPPIALSHLTLLRATPHARSRRYSSADSVSETGHQPHEFCRVDVVGDHFLRS